MPRDSRRLRFSLLVAMMATSGVALIAQGSDAIPPEILAMTGQAVDAVPDLAIGNRAAEASSVPDASAGLDISAGPIVSVLIEGESTSDPAGGWNPYPAQVAANMGDKVAVVADGVNGAGISQVIAEGSKAQFLSEDDGQNVAVLWIGINDIAHGVDPTDVYSGIVTWVADRRSEGWNRVVLVTVTKFESSFSTRDSSWGSHKLSDEMRSDLNKMIVANSAGADAIVDLRNVEGIGDDYSVDDQHWRPDRVHLTTAGYALVAEHVTAAISYRAT